MMGNIFKEQDEMLKEWLREKSISIAVGRDDIERLDYLRKVTGLSRSELVRIAIDILIANVAEFLGDLRDAVMDREDMGDDTSDPAVKYEILRDAFDNFRPDLRMAKVLLSRMLWNRAHEILEELIREIEGKEDEE